MAKKKQLTDRELIDKAGGVRVVTEYLGFSTTAAVYNWLGNDKKRLMPKHWRMILENKIAAK